MPSVGDCFESRFESCGELQVETVGDCYVVAGGLIQADGDGFSCVVPATPAATHVTSLALPRPWWLRRARC